MWGPIRLWGDGKNIEKLISRGVGVGGNVYLAPLEEYLSMHDIHRLMKAVLKLHALTQD